MAVSRNVDADLDDDGWAERVGGRAGLAGADGEVVELGHQASSPMSADDCLAREPGASRPRYLTLGSVDLTGGHEPLRSSRPRWRSALVGG